MANSPRAQKLERDRKRLERLGVQAARPLAASLIGESIAAFELGHGRVPDFSPMGEALAVLIAEASRAAHLAGAVSVVNAAAPVLRANTGLQVFDKAVEFAQCRLTLSDEQLIALIAKYEADALLISRTLVADLELAVQTEVAASIAEGDLVKDGAKRIATVFDKAGVTARNPFVYQTIFRTATATAFSAGRWEVWQDPIVDEILWGFEYDTVGDDRVRDKHVLMDGTKLPKKDPRWNTITPPNGFNCRCVLL